MEECKQEYYWCEDAGCMVDCSGWSDEDWLAAAKKFETKKTNTNGHEFKLEVGEYIQLMMDADIKAHEIGVGRGKYCLARKCIETGKVDGDLSYSIQTCRFILFEDNLKEGNSGEEHPLFGKSHSGETKQKMSDSRKGITPSTKQSLHLIKMANSNIGRTHSDESKQKMSDKLKTISKIQCPHCLKSGARGAMARWHFNNCKLKDVHEEF